MKITINGSKYSILYEEGRFAVHVADCVFRANTVIQLIEELDLLPERTVSTLIYSIVSG